MKKIFFIILLSAAPLLTGSAQEDADSRIGNLINRSDWFGLEKTFSQVKDSMQHTFLKRMAEAMICANFNRPEEAIASIDRLLAEHQEDAGFENSIHLIYLKSLINGWEGRYGEAAHGMKDLMDQLKDRGMESSMDRFKALYAYYEPIRAYLPPALTRPDRDTEIPLTIEKAGRGVLMYVPVSIHGKTYTFIFDTGAATTFMSERFAAETGVKILNDSLWINDGIGLSSGGAYGLRGYLDSMQIGDMTFKQILVAIARANPAVDTVYQVDAVLGMDFMKLAKEIRICPGEKRIVFPVQHTPLPPTGRNILLATGNRLRLDAYSGDERLFFVFDSGNVRADLYAPYYVRHKEAIDQTGKKETVKMGGFDHVGDVDVLRIPSLPLRIGNTAFEMKDIHVITASEGDPTSEDGSLGMDLIQLFSRITINFEAMFLEVE
jgi:predicted aspartyl protease